MHTSDVHSCILYVIGRSSCFSSGQSNVIFSFLCVCAVQTCQLLFLYSHLPILFISVNWPAAVGHTLATWKETIYMAHNNIQYNSKLIDLQQQCILLVMFYCLCKKLKIPTCWKQLILCFSHLQTDNENPRYIQYLSISNHILLLFAWNSGLLRVTYRR